MPITNAQAENHGSAFDQVVMSWGVQPDYRVGTLARSAISAQRFTLAGPVHELENLPLPNVNIVGFVFQGEPRHQYWADGKLTIDGLLPSRSALIVPAGTAPRSVISDRVDVLHIYLPQFALRSIADEIDFPEDEVQLVDRRDLQDPVLQNFAAIIDSQARVSAMADLLTLDYVGLGLTAHILRTYSSFREPTRGRARIGALAPWQVARVTDFLEDHLADNVTLDEIAALVNLSKTHFCRAFKAATGNSPLEWRLRRRISRAQFLLETRKLDLSQIALICGFANQTHFTHQSRRIVGAAPGQWRRARIDVVPEPELQRAQST